MEMSLSFNEIQFDIIDRENQPWVRLPQIEVALGFAKRGAIQTLYTRHADEFTDAMTALVKLPSDGGEQETRIFSLRGCHLLAMFARTPVAKAFRKWVLDVLDRLAQEEREAQGTEFITPDQQCTIQALVKARIGAIPENIRPKGLYPQIYSRFNNHFRLGSYKQLPQKRMSEAVTYLAQLEIEPLKLEKKPEALPEPELDAQTYMDGKMLFDILGKTKWDLENAATRLLLSYPSRNLFLPPEKEILFENLCDCIRAATAGVNTAIYNVRSACRLRSRVKFVGK